MSNEGGQDNGSRFRRAAFSTLAAAAIGLGFGQRAPEASAINSPTEVDLQDSLERRVPKITIGGVTYETVFPEALNPVEISKNQAVIFNLEENGSFSVRLSPSKEPVDISREVDCLKVGNDIVANVLTEPGSKIPVAVLGDKKVFALNGTTDLDPENTVGASDKITVQSHGIYPRPDADEGMGSDDSSAGIDEVSDEADEANDVHHYFGSGNGKLSTDNEDNNSQN